MTPGDGGERPRLGGRQRWLGVLLALAIVGGAVGIARPWEQAAKPGLGVVEQVRPTESGLADLETAPEPGKLAPNFRLASVDGQELRLSELRGRPVFLNFWATWCFPCLTEMPAIQRLSDEYGDAFVAVGVNNGESIEDARTFATNFELRFPILVDPEQDVVRAYRVRSMPTSLFIDADGVVRSVDYGILTPPQMRERLAPLLTGTPETVAHSPAPPSRSGRGFIVWRTAPLERFPRFRGRGVGAATGRDGRGHCQGLRGWTGTTWGGASGGRSPGGRRG